VPISNTDSVRERILEDEEKEANRQGGRPTFPVEVKGATRHLSIFKVAIHVPKYRLENGRTIRGLQEFVHQNADAEKALGDGGSAEAQEIIEKVLLSMIEKENLYQNLADEGQRDPLILTKQGYVLNGNRRLAAMRKLSRDPKFSKRFQNVDVVLLPQLDEQELSTIEMRLQMSIEGKAPYNWLDELLVIQKNIKHLKMDFERVRSAMRTTMPALNKKLLIYELVGEYLRFTNREDQYFSVEGDKQAFQTLADGIKRYESRLDLQRLLKEQAFNIILKKPKTKSVHLQITDVINVIPRLNQPKTVGSSNNTNARKDDPLAGLVTSNAKPLSPMSEVEFRERQKEVARHQQEHELNRSYNEQLKRAEDSLSILNMIDEDLARAKREKISEVLQQIEATAKKIRQIILND